MSGGGRSAIPGWPRSDRSNRGARATAERAGEKISGASATLEFLKSRLELERSAALSESSHPHSLCDPVGFPLGDVGDEFEAEP